MLTRLLLAVVFAFSLLTPATIAPPTASAADCQFVLGFKLIHDMIPAIVGACTVDEHHNPTNGDGLQETTGPTGAGGLLVWRKADNWTAYTDGYRTWVNGPNGLQQRLNTERFSFEADDRTGVPAATPIVTPPTATPTPTPVAAPPAINWPAGASALCKDGSFSYSQSRSGTCSQHGGVAVWNRN
jgi:Protein of unknown function (DUF3761)